MHQAPCTVSQGSCTTTAHTRRQSRGLAGCGYVSPASSDCGRVPMWARGLGMTSPSPWEEWSTPGAPTLPLPPRPAPSSTVTPTGRGAPSGVGGLEVLVRRVHVLIVPASGSGRRSSVSGRPLEGWRAASKGLGPLPRRRGSALAHGCDRGGRVVLPLARAAAVSTGLRVPAASEGVGSGRAA